MGAGDAGEGGVGAGGVAEVGGVAAVPGPIMEPLLRHPPTMRVAQAAVRLLIIRG